MVIRIVLMNLVLVHAPDLEDHILDHMVENMQLRKRITIPMKVAPDIRVLTGEYYIFIYHVAVTDFFVYFFFKVLRFHIF